jgi:hypothetical protein
MDESHRYRASAGVRSINELKPLFGLEVTATPFVESTRGPVPFKNVVMDYPLQKFDSDTERRFAVILERDALKWFKPAKGQFQIYYKLGSEQPEYIPDFVAETESVNLMVETKKRDDLASDEVKSKAAAAARWCAHASEHTARVGGKP